MKVSQLLITSQERSNVIMLDGYIEHMLEAYNNSKISYAELRKHLTLANKSPNDFGYPEMTAEDYAMIKWEHALLDADFLFLARITTNMNAIEEYVGALAGK